MHPCMLNGLLGAEYVQYSMPVVFITAVEAEQPSRDTLLPTKPLETEHLLTSLVMAFEYYTRSLFILSLFIFLPPLIY